MVDGQHSISTDFVFRENLRIVTNRFDKRSCAAVDSWRFTWPAMAELLPCALLCFGLLRKLPREQSLFCDTRHRIRVDS